MKLKMENGGLNILLTFENDNAVLTVNYDHFN